MGEKQITVSIPEPITKYPIGYLLFILTSGSFFILSFPYDIFSIDFSNGLILPDARFFEYLGQNFKPFINIKYLSTDSLLSFSKITLLFWITGIFFFFMRDLFCKFNNILKCGLTNFPKIKGIYSNLTRSRSKKGNIDQLEFAVWARTNKHANHTDFLWSIREITVGLLYASETFFLFTFFAIISPIVLKNTVLIVSSFFRQFNLPIVRGVLIALFPTVDHWLQWLVFSCLLFVESIVIYFIFGKKFDSDMEQFWKKFDNRPKPKEN